MVTIKNINKVWGISGSENVIFENFSLQIAKGDFIALIGKNGTGKTTLFNIIAALDKNYSGDVTVNNSKKYRIGYVFQNYRQSLFPWLTIFQNIAYPLRLEGKSEVDCKKIINDLCREFDLKIDFGKYPYELSGGQQQIVSTLRALVFKPEVLLLDEPFSAVDYDSTLSLMNLLQQIWLKTGITILLISHDIDEAIILAKNIYILQEDPKNKVRGNFINLEPYPRSVLVMGKPETIKLKEKILKAFISTINSKKY